MRLPRCVLHPTYGRHQQRRHHDEVFSWGKGANGQLGVGALPDALSSVTEIGYITATPVAAVACGLDHSSIVTSECLCGCVACTLRLQLCPPPPDGRSAPPLPPVPLLLLSCHRFLALDWPDLYLLAALRPSNPPFRRGRTCVS